MSHADESKEKVRAHNLGMSFANTARHLVLAYTIYCNINSMVLCLKYIPPPIQVLQELYNNIIPFRDYRSLWVDKSSNVRAANLVGYTV